MQQVWPHRRHHWQLLLLTDSEGATFVVVQEPLFKILSVLFCGWERQSCWEGVGGFW